MYKYILEGAGNINWMAIFALLTFFFLFSISAIVIFTKRRAWVDHMSHLPLDEQPTNSEKPLQHEK